LAITEHLREAPALLASRKKEKPAQFERESFLNDWKGGEKGLILRKESDRNQT